MSHNGNPRFSAPNAGGDCRENDMNSQPKFAALPSTPVQPGALVDALAALVGDEDLAVWRKLLSFASYDEIIDRDELADFFSEVLAALDKLVGIIDAL